MDLLVIVSLRVEIAWLYSNEFCAKILTDNDNIEQHDNRDKPNVLRTLLKRDQKFQKPTEWH